MVRDSGKKVHPTPPSSVSISQKEEDERKSEYQGTKSRQSCGKPKEESFRITAVSIIR